tara:strand:+ start:1676 stop:2194 length:519 start_codon:yes stop_codon:yes gene_type:complete
LEKEDKDVDLLHQAIPAHRYRVREHIQEKDLHLRTLLVLLNTLLLAVAVVVMILDLVVCQEHLQPTHQVVVVLDKIIHHQIQIILQQWYTLLPIMAQMVKMELVVSQHRLTEQEPGLDMEILVDGQQDQEVTQEMVLAVAAVLLVLVLMHLVMPVVPVEMDKEFLPFHTVLV